MLWSAAVMAALVAALLVAVRAERRVLHWVIKPAASATFVLAAVAAGALDSGWGTILFAGLIAAALGDVLLISESRTAFTAGLVAFLLGHVAYAIAFWVRGVDAAWLAAAAAVMAAAALPVLRWLWPHVEPPMRGPVLAYVVVITAMVAVAVGTTAHAADLRIVVGAVGFYLSDLSVARDRFVAPGFVNRAWGLPLYFGSQLLLAWSPA